MLVGGSFGGYLAMELLGQYPKDYSSAVVMMCGQNVGQGRSWKASAGLWLMDVVSKKISADKMVSKMVSMATNVDKAQLITILRAGYYFQHSDKQIEFLKSTNPGTSLPKFNGRVLFINGSKDHRDSEKMWLEHCKNKQSKLIVYDDTDHFFSHDKRYFIRLCNDIDNFIQ